MELRDMKNETADGSEAKYINTMAALRQAESSLPVYSSSYDGEIRSIYEKIVNRPGFKYEFSADPVYGEYKTSYANQGKRAMQDGMAQAANLTGGYGSSYAQSVGQQQYGTYLEKLNQLMPELYSAAYDRYKAEGDRLQAQLEAASGLEQKEYRRYNDERNYGMEQAKFEYQKQAEAYKNLMNVISTTGYVPGDDELEQAGMSREQADALGYEFMRRHGLLKGKAKSKEINYYNLHPTSPFDIGYREGMFDE